MNNDITTALERIAAALETLVYLAFEEQDKSNGDNT
jgi:hypothetical protein